jgi:hypothetical protein
MPILKPRQLMVRLSDKLLTCLTAEALEEAKRPSTLLREILEREMKRRVIQKRDHVKMEAPN